MVDNSSSSSNQESLQSSSWYSFTLSTTESKSCEKPLSVLINDCRECLNIPKSIAPKEEGEISKINRKVNEIFLKKVQELETECDVDACLVLVTYQEWVRMLLTINQSIVSNAEELESQVAERLTHVMDEFKSINNNDTILEYGRDISKLIDIIQKAYKFGNWDFSDVHFESIKQDDILNIPVKDIKVNKCPEVALQKTKEDDFKPSKESDKLLRRKLQFFRTFLMNLYNADGESCIWIEWDPGLFTNIDCDKDLELLDSVKNRFQCLFDSIRELNIYKENLELKRKELCCCLEIERKTSMRYGEMLKGIADILNSLTDANILYNDISSNENPFRKAIIDLKENFDKRERKLMNSLADAKEMICYLEGVTKHKQNGKEYPSHKMQCTVDKLRSLLNEKEKRIVQLKCTLSKLSTLPPEHVNNNVICEVAAPIYNDREKEELCMKLEKANNEIECLRIDLERSHNQEQFHSFECRNLNMELLDLKRKNGELITHLQKLNNLLQSQEMHRVDLVKKYKEMEKNYDDQVKRLSTASAQLKFLQDRLALFDKRQDENCMERNLLRDEVLSLKEKEATLLGKNKSVEDQLIRMEEDLYKANTIIKQQQAIMQHNDISHNNIVKQLNETHDEVKQCLAFMANENKILKDQNTKHNEVHLQNQKVIDSFRKWRDAQIIADDSTQRSFKQYDEHIKLLLEDKQKTLEEFRNLHRDYAILKCETDRLKMFSSQIPGLIDNSQFTNRVDLIRRTSRRVSEQNNAMDCNGANVTPNNLS